MEKERKLTLPRRDFLRAFGMGAVAVAGCEPLADQAVTDSESTDEKLKPRYQAESEDVQAFYRVNRYPS
jgi:hypothetical protein